MKVLLTGGGGFMGHHTILYLIKNTSWELVVTDSFRNGGMSSRIRDIFKELTPTEIKRIKIVTHDLSTPIDKVTFQEFGKINVIINAASLANVDDSIKNPVPFVQNNINIGLNIFEYARNLDSLNTIIHVSTDEVFGDAEHIDQHFENHPVSPSNPYSASKVGQEAIANAYWRTYNLPIIITNATNMFGERQNEKSFIPKAIGHIIKNEPVPIHIKNINNQTKISSRLYLYVQNQIDAIKFLIENFQNIDHGYSSGLKSINRFNVSGNKEFYNNDIALMISDILNIKDISFSYINPSETRPGLDIRYSLNCDKIKSLGWKEPFEFNKALEKTVLWYASNKKWLDV